MGPAQVCTENIGLRRQCQSALERLSELEGEHTRLVEASLTRKAMPTEAAVVVGSRAVRRPSSGGARQRGRQHSEQGQFMAVREWLQRSLGRELTPAEFLSTTALLTVSYTSMVAAV